jgi:hypothetical protein
MAAVATETAKMLKKLKNTNMMLRIDIHRLGAIL